MAKRVFLAALLLLLPLPLLAQKTVTPNAQIEMRDGDPIEITLPHHAAHGVIIEFRDPPLTRRAGKATRRVVAGYRATFDRFRADVAALAGGRREIAIGEEYFEAFNGVSFDASSLDLAKIRALPYVKAVYPDVMMSASASGEAAPPANVRQVNADKLWREFGTRGDGVVVAVIDTGIDYNHPALGGGFGPGHRVIGGYDFFNKDKDPFDDAGHGTHVAGIIGGRSDQLLGVAPEVSFLAYKVLDAGGSGPESTILAAIEKTVDPNGDGDTSDHVAVANMSLGGLGGPDDPLSQAVDNATAAGVVFTIAAGNSRSYHTIGSPGTAQSAITVGAVDATDAIAFFSSRGPNMRDLAIKPEVVAPGVNIVSSFPGGMYQPMSGTSMAAPHVAGVAALLRRVHPDWTPEQVKSAIVSGAFDGGSDPMAQGNGRVDALHAATSVLQMEPAVLSFGLDPVQRNRWQASAMMRLTNKDANRVEINFTPVDRPGVSVTLDETTFSLAPGESRVVTVTLDVTNATATPGAGTYVVGGSIPMTVNGALQHVAWAFSKAARLTTRGDEDITLVALANADGASAAAILGDGTTEALVPPGTYDVIGYAAIFGTRSVPGVARLYRRASTTIDSDDSLDFVSSEARHRVAFEAHDSRGVLLRDAPQSYFANVRLLFPDTWKVASLMVPGLPSVTQLSVSDLVGTKLMAFEQLMNLDDHVLVLVQHPPVADIVTDVTLGDEPDLVSRNVRFFIPKLGETAWLQMFGMFQGSKGGEPGMGLGFAVPVEPLSEWTGRIEMNPDPTPGYSASVTATVYGVQDLMYETPQLSAKNGAIIARGGPPWQQDVDTLAFGYGPNVPVSRLGMFGQQPVLVTMWNGECGEMRAFESSRATVDVFDAAGSHVMRAAISRQLALPLSAPGAYRAELVSTTGHDFLTMTFDTTRSDVSPPAITWFAFSDSTGATVTDFAPATGGRLRFSIADTALDPAATRVSWRPHADSLWRTLSAVQIAEDRDYGVLYSVDLSPLTHVPSSSIDLRIEAADVSGNAATLRLEPAFQVKPAGGTRTRPARR